MRHCCRVPTLELHEGGFKHQERPYAAIIECHIMSGAQEMTQTAMAKLFHGVIIGDDLTLQ